MNTSIMFILADDPPITVFIGIDSLTFRWL